MAKLSEVKRKNTRIHDVECPDCKVPSLIFLRDLELDEMEEIVGGYTSMIVFCEKCQNGFYTNRYNDTMIKQEND